MAGFLRGEVVNAGGNVRFDPRQIEAFSEGTVGWATTMLRITLPDGGTVSPRWSSVLHREGDQWKFVQNPRLDRRPERSGRLGLSVRSAGRSYPRLTLTALSGSSLSKQRW